MFIFWLAAAGTSRLNCNDLCNACSSWDYGDGLYFGDLACACGSGYYWWKKRAMSPAPKKGLLEARRVRHTTAGGTWEARTAMDAIMVYVPFPLLNLRSCFIENKDPCLFVLVLES